MRLSGIFLAMALLSTVARAEAPLSGIAALERLYDSKHDPDVLIEIARLYESAATDGDPRDARLAIFYYEKYLAEKESGTEPSERVVIDRRPIDAAIAHLRTLALAPVTARAAGGAVPVSFLAYRGEGVYEVTVGEQRCRTPCKLELKPGPATAHVSGNGSLDLQMVVPHLPAQVRLQAVSSGYTIAGAIMVPVGATVAASFWAIAVACTGIDRTSCQLGNIIAWPLIGGIVFFTGIGLLAYGASHRPAVDANRPEILDARRKTPFRWAGSGFVF